MTKRSPISNLPTALAMVVCGLAACGELDPAMLGTGAMSGSGGTGDMSQLLPLKIGNSWTYLVTYSGGESGVVTVIPKTQTVMGEELVGGTGPNTGVTAFRMVTLKKTDGTWLTVSWQARVGTRIVRYREQAFFVDAPHGLKREDHWDPAKLRVDETPDHLVLGATWLEVSQQTRAPASGVPYTEELQDTWTVVAERQPVTVQGRSYEVLILEKTGSDRKTYWWARGIGKVKEIGSDGVEELMSYSLTL